MGEEGSDLEKKIAEIFDVFDHAGNKSVDVREVGTIIRALGCCPSEQDIQEVIAQVEDEQASGSVQYDKFLPYIMEVIRENKMQPADPEMLLKAFLVLDEQKKGYLTKDELVTAMMEEGEQFTQEEVDEMLTVAVDGETGYIPYEYYINQLMMTKEIYKLKSQETEKANKKKSLSPDDRRSTVASLRKTLEMAKKSISESKGEEGARTSEASVSRSSKSPSKAEKLSTSDPAPSTSAPGSSSLTAPGSNAAPAPTPADTQPQSTTGGAGSPMIPSPTGSVPPSGDENPPENPIDT